MTRGTAAAALGGRPGPRFTGATGFGGDCSVRGFFAFGADPAESSESSARICMSLFMTAVCCEGFIWLSSATTGLDCASDLCDPCGTCAWLVCGATACLVFSATICGFFVSTASAASDGLIPLAASAASRANFGAGAAPATKRVTPCMASSRRGRACAAVSDDVVRIRLLLYGGRAPVAKSVWCGGEAGVGCQVVGARQVCSAPPPASARRTVPLLNRPLAPPVRAAVHDATTHARTYPRTALRRACRRVRRMVHPRRVHQHVR